VERRHGGKPNCRCAIGDAGWKETVLSYKEGGRRKVLILPTDEVEVLPGCDVRAALD